MTCDLLVSKSDLCLQPLMWRDCEKCPVKMGPMDEISHDEREISQGEQKKKTQRPVGETRHPGEGGVPYSKLASGTENGYLGIAHSSEAEAVEREECLNVCDVCEDLGSIRSQHRSIKISSTERRHASGAPT